jgi:hypothetical protein
MLNGFRQFFESEAQYTPLQSGLKELTRLEKGHYLIALPADEETVYRYLNGSDGLRFISNEMIVNAYDISVMSKTAKEPILIMSIPKRWFHKPQLEQKGITGAIGELLPLGDGWHLPANYVWGYFSKWHENREENLEPGQFYKNQNYHGHDGLYEKWKQTYQKRVPTAILDRPTPRVTAPYAAHSGLHTFHGYNAFDFDSSQL